MLISRKKREPEWQGLAGPGLLSLAIVIAINIPLAQARMTGPKVVVAEYRHSFGDVFAGQFMDHAFTIRNEGTSPLTLSDEVPHAPKAAWNRLSSPGGSPSVPVAFRSGSSGFLSLNVAKAAATASVATAPAPT